MKHWYLRDYEEYRNSSSARLFQRNFLGSEFFFEVFSSRTSRKNYFKVGRGLKVRSGNAQMSAMQPKVSRGDTFIGRKLNVYPWFRGREKIFVISRSLLYFGTHTVSY